MEELHNIEFDSGFYKISELNKVTQKAVEKKK